MANVTQVASASTNTCYELFHHQNTLPSVTRDCTVSLIGRRYKSAMVFVAFEVRSTEASD